MKTVPVAASRPYEILIGSGLLPQLGQHCLPLCKGRTACLVSDDTVYSLYGDAAGESLEQAGFSVFFYVFPHGEQSKSPAVLLELLEFLAEHHLTRADLLLALGGGVVGDLTGFAASCYLRGLPYVQIPTTLLAMVDSSVGGKTAIDLRAGKNLCGAFWQPSLVLCDTDTLNTLPADTYRDGCAEVIKYAILGDPRFFDRLFKPLPAEEIVRRCVTMKRDIVEQDERDTGLRQLLNLGHTLGHAVEAGSHYELSHGKAVAIGTAMIARAACQKGDCSEKTRDEILKLLQLYGLPTETNQDKHELLKTALGDKKRRGDTITLVVPRQIGACRLVTVPVDQLGEWII